jgi:hypothetical protein
MAATPNFPNQPRTYAPAVATTAVAVRSSPPTANVAVLATGTSNGTRIDQIDFNSGSAAASSANLIRLWFQQNGNTTWFLLREIAFPGGLAAGTTTNSANVRLNFDKSNLETPLRLSNGDKLGFSTHLADTVVGVACGWDY